MDVVTLGDRHVSGMARAGFLVLSQAGLQAPSSMVLQPWLEPFLGFLCSRSRQPACFCALSAGRPHPLKISPRKNDFKIHPKCSYSEIVFL